jgi:hypothetical protein
VLVCHNQTSSVSTPTAVDYVIVSDNYWPSLPRGGLRYHPAVEALLGEYQEVFGVLKKPRKLLPAPQLGQVGCLR